MRRMYLAVLLALLLAGCTSWLPQASRVEIQQGNLLDADDIAALEPGMTRAAVREQIGAPVLVESFNRNRWDYIYYLTEAGRESGEVQRLSLYFEGERLTRIEDGYVPPDPPDPEDVPDIPEEDRPAPGQQPPGQEPAPGPSPGPDV